MGVRCPQQAVDGWVSDKIAPMAPPRTPRRSDATSLQPASRFGLRRLGAGRPRRVPMPARLRPQRMPRGQKLLGWWRRLQRPERRPLPPALALSLVIHLLVLSQLFGDGLGGAGWVLPWQERRAAADVQVVLTPPSQAAAMQPALAPSAALLPPVPKTAALPVQRLQVRRVVLASPVAPEAPQVQPAVPRRAVAVRARPEPRPMGDRQVALAPAEVPRVQAAIPVIASASAPEAAASASLEAVEEALRREAERAAALEAARQALLQQEAIAREAREQQVRLLEAQRLETARLAAAQAEALAAQEQAQQQAKAAAQLAAQQAAEQDAAAQVARRIAEDAARAEAQRREAQLQEQMRQEEARQLAAQAARLQAERLLAEQQAAERRAAELAQQRQEALRREALAQEAARQEALRQEALRLAAQAEAARLDAQQREQHLAAQREAQRLDALRQQAAERQAAERRAAERQAAELEAQRQEAARQTAARAEAARQEAERQEAARAAALADAARQQAAQLAAQQAAQRAAQQAALQATQQSARLAEQQAAQDAEARREARLRAIGRQLDDERAQREAQAKARAGGALPLSLSTARRLRLWGRTDPNADLVDYAEAWARKIQFNTPVETVREVAARPHQHPMVTVAMRSDGSVESVTFVVSSGVAEIDETIRRIIESQKPFPAFSPALARDADVVEIRRTWYFDSAVRLH